MDGIDSKKSSLLVNEEGNETANTQGANTKSTKNKRGSVAGANVEQSTKAKNKKTDPDEDAGGHQNEKGGSKTTGGKNSD